MDSKIKVKTIVTLFGGLIAAGMVGGSFFVGRSLERFRIQERIVKVKGLAEKEVKADLAVLTVPFKAQGNNLNEIHHSLNEQRSKVVEFFKKQGFTDKEINTSPVPKLVFDRAEKNSRQDWQDNSNSSERDNRPQYIFEDSVYVVTKKVDEVTQSFKNVKDLMTEGVVLRFKDWGGSPIIYRYTKFDELRPVMFKEAIESAKNMSKQFAVESGSSVGKIQKASQGRFEILPSYNNSAVSGDGYFGEENYMYKNVRVVVDVDFRLVD